MFVSQPEGLVLCSAPGSDCWTTRVMPPGQFAWIGLNKNSLVWVDGTSPAFTYWRSGEPNDDKDKCVVANFDDSGKWEDYPCDFNFPFFCYGGEF
uniref:C-type lectin domain-containing protein n=1 Tax=Poecilia reticulata TaxID=8081 RepID=A0A3P9N585_POERE